MTAQAPSANHAEPDPALGPLLDLLQLGQRVRAAGTAAELGFVMVNETLHLLPYRQAVLWRGGVDGQVAALSGVPQVDSTVPYVQWLKTLGRQLAQPATAAGPVDLAQLPEPVAAAWGQWWPPHAVWLPWPAGPATRPAPGGLLLAREQPWRAHELALLEQLAGLYGHAWAALQPAAGLRQRWRAAWRRSVVRWGLAVGLLAAMLVPMRITVLAPAEVVPRDPFVVRAPLAGVVDRFDVRPNQAVAAGAPLFSLDTNELRARWAMAERAHDTALQEYRQTTQAAVTSDKNRLDISTRHGRLQERAVELDYTASLLARAQVRAERAGTAVFADAHDWIGKSVAVGERILLLADPAAVELTAWMPAGDAIDVKVGDVLTLYPQGDPFNAYRAVVQTVAFRAEPARDGHLAYRIKASFEAGQAPPRIGQLGTAHVDGGWAPLAVVALRRPLATARQWLGW
jgi:multidrug resistance efflux pump